MALFPGLARRIAGLHRGESVFTAPACARKGLASRGCSCPGGQHRCACEGTWVSSAGTACLCGYEPRLFAGGPCHGVPMLHSQSLCEQLATNCPRPLRQTSARRRPRATERDLRGLRNEAAQKDVEDVAPLPSTFPSTIHFPRIVPVGQGFLRNGTMSRRHGPIYRTILSHLPADLGFYGPDDFLEFPGGAGRSCPGHGNSVDSAITTIGSTVSASAKALLRGCFVPVIQTLPFCHHAGPTNTGQEAWNGTRQDVVAHQTYSAEDGIRQIRARYAAFRDPRYMRIDGKPIFLVYRVSKSCRGPFRFLSVFVGPAEAEGVGSPERSNLSSKGPCRKLLTVEPIMV